MLGIKEGSVLVGVVACAAFACHSVVQGEAVHERWYALRVSSLRMILRWMSLLMLRLMVLSFI